MHMVYFFPYINMSMNVEFGSSEFAFTLNFILRYRSRPEQEYERHCGHAQHRPGIARLLYLYINTVRVCRIRSVYICYLYVQHIRRCICMCICVCVCVPMRTFMYVRLYALSLQTSTGIDYNRVTHSLTFTHTHTV